MWRWIPANKQYSDSIPYDILPGQQLKVSWTFCLNAGNYFHALVFLSL